MAYNASHYHLGPSTHLQNTSYVPPLKPSGIPSYKDTTSSYPPSCTSAQDLHDLKGLGGRTPSPSSSEEMAMRGSRIENLKYTMRNKPLYFLIIAVIITLVVLMSVYDEQITNWLKPVTKWLHGRLGGWLVPIAVLFVISFPPVRLFRTRNCIMCGVVWGYGLVFAIVTAGTLLGEIANYFVFKYWCRARSGLYEKKYIAYSCIVRVIREGGFIIAVIVRLSAIPAHFTTTVFATCGMNFFVFVAAAILTMPKQLISIYIGVVLEQNAEGTETSKSRKISNIILIVTTILTVVAGIYIKRKSKQVYQKHKARYVKSEAQIIAQESFALGHGRDILLPLPTKNTGSIVALSTVNSRDGPSGELYDAYLEVPQFNREYQSPRKYTTM